MTVIRLVLKKAASPVLTQNKLAHPASQKVGAPVVETPQDGKEGVEQLPGSSWEPATQIQKFAVGDNPSLTAKPAGPPLGSIALLAKVGVANVYMGVWGKDCRGLDPMTVGKAKWSLDMSVRPASTTPPNTDAKGAFNGTNGIPSNEPPQPPT